MGCQFGVNWGENRGCAYWILTGTKGVSGAAIHIGLCQVSSKSNKNFDRESADTQTEMTGDLIICRMLCYSSGTDQKLKLSI